MTTITSKFTKERLIDWAVVAVAERVRDLKDAPESVEAAANLKLAEIALASLTTEPVAWKYRLVDINSGTGDHWKYSTQCITPTSGKTHCIESVPLYTAPPVQETGVYNDVLNIIGLLENNEWAEHCTSTVLGSLLESEITRLVGKEQPVPVMPVGLRMALSNAGIAAPESDEMLAATHEKYIQALVTWVKDRKPFQPAPVVPEDISGIIERFQYQADHLSDWYHIDEHSCKVNRRDLMTALEFMDSCRAAMLNGAKS